VDIFYKDWDCGQPIVFSHGWPLGADDWDGQMFSFQKHGFRVNAHDRRGHGCSSQTSAGHDMDSDADDLAALFEALDLTGAVMVGHSTGGGEVAHHLGRHGTGRVAMAALINAAPPMIKSQVNPGGAPMQSFDGLRASLAANRAQFYMDMTFPFYGYNRPGALCPRGRAERQAAQEGDAQDRSRPPARYLHDPGGRDQCRPSGLHQGLIRQAGVPSAIGAVRARMGWRFLGVSSFTCDFNYDIGVLFTPERVAFGPVSYNYRRIKLGMGEQPGDSVFYKHPNGAIFHTYSSFSRGGEQFPGAYGFPTVTSNERAETGPYFNLGDRVRLHDT
jgi:pimeloyl-ACP methyl ester carboxylesterase